VEGAKKSEALVLEKGGNESGLKKQALERARNSEGFLEVGHL
jgi:hypothetical protein